MVFTIEEIETTLQKSNENWQDHFQERKDVKKNSNYPIVIDYLTGVSNSLSGLQQDNTNYLWSALLHFFTDVENINNKEQLILDVLYHPEIFYFIQFHINEFLLRYALKNKRDNAFGAVLQQFYKQGMSDSDIFKLLHCKHALR